MINYIIIGLCVLLALIFNAMMDAISHNFPTSFAKNWKPEFWNPAVSWVNKWQRDKNGEFILDKNGSKIRTKILGITIPAAFTDAWHLLKMFMLGFLFIAISIDVGDLQSSIIKFISISVLWNVMFNLIYYKLRYW